jgi:hypothetical protein
MAMRDFYEHALHEQFRELAARDRQLERWGWFRRHEHRPRKIGWRFRAGEALIRLGSWLQERRAARPARTSGQP